MLKHRTLGPMADGAYLVVYPTPGCNVQTTVCDCATEEQARKEAQRLNRQQRKIHKQEQRTLAARERRNGIPPGRQW